MFPLCNFPSTDSHPAPGLWIPTYPCYIQSWVLSFSPTEKSYCDGLYTYRHSPPRMKSTLLCFNKCHWVIIIFLTVRTYFFFNSVHENALYRTPITRGNGLRVIVAILFCMFASRAHPHRLSQQMTELVGDTKASLSPGEMELLSQLTLVSGLPEGPLNLILHSHLDGFFQISFSVSFTWGQSLMTLPGFLSPSSLTGISPSKILAHLMLSWDLLLQQPGLTQETLVRTMSEVFPTEFVYGSLRYSWLWILTILSWIYELLTVWVCEGCHNKVPKSWWLKQKKWIFS